MTTVTATLLADAEPADWMTWLEAIERSEQPLPDSETPRELAERLLIENGIVTADIAEYMYELLGRNAPVIEIPEAYHHMMLDQPLLLVTGLRTLLADWEHSVPRSRRR